MMLISGSINGHGFQVWFEWPESQEEPVYYYYWNGQISDSDWYDLRSCWEDLMSKIQSVLPSM